MKPLFPQLKKVFETEKGHAFIFPASGTGGWEAAITNTLSPGDKVLAQRFGQFSHLWIDLCNRLGLEVVKQELSLGHRQRSGADRGDAEGRQAPRDQGRSRDA